MYLLPSEEILCSFFLHPTTYGTLVPQPGIEPVSPALGVQSLNHWTTISLFQFIKFLSYQGISIFEEIWKMEKNSKSHHPKLPSHFAVFFISIPSTPQHALLSEIENVCICMCLCVVTLCAYSMPGKILRFNMYLSSQQTGFLLPHFTDEEIQVYRD